MRFYSLILIEGAQSIDLPRSDFANDGGAIVTKVARLTRTYKKGINKHRKSISFEDVQGLEFGGWQPFVTPGKRVSFPFS